MASQEPIYRHLTDDGLVGDGTNQNANVNGVVTPVPFWYGPSTGKAAIHRLILVIEDAGTLAADNYGAISALGNGLHIRIMKGHQTTGGLVVDLLDGDPITNHADWGSVCYDVAEHSYGTGNNFVLARWTFSNAGRPLILDSFQNEKLVITVRDDLTGLVKHQFKIQGHAFNQEGHQVNTWGM